MKVIRKVLLYIIVFLLIVQIGLGYIISPQLIYNYRMNYEIIKDRVTDIEAALTEVKRTIDREQLKDYVIILGDSVGYSRPGPVDGSIGYYLDQRARASGRSFRVFNLSLPAMQMGDLYTMLLKMDQYGISRDHVIINILYAGFIKRDTTRPIVTWLPQELKSLDPDTYKLVGANGLLNKKYIKKSTNYVTFLTDKLKYKMYETVSIFKYKDYIRLFFLTEYKKLRGKPITEPAVLPWFKKPFLVSLMKKPAYQNDFSDVPFVMDESNWQIYFLDKIIDMQKGKDTLIFLAANNNELMKENMQKPNFQENLRKIDEYFAKKPVQYINFNGKIEIKLFSDHVHLTPSGYKYLSDILWDYIEKWRM